MPIDIDVYANRREFLAFVAGAALLVVTPAALFAAESLRAASLPAGLPNDLGRITDPVERTFDLGGL